MKRNKQQVNFPIIVVGNLALVLTNDDETMIKD